MNKRIQNKIAFGLFAFGGLYMLNLFGLYFVMCVPILIIIYILVIKLLK
jgi:hypothetical protein